MQRLHHPAAGMAQQRHQFRRGRLGHRRGASGGPGRRLGTICSMPKQRGDGQHDAEHGGDQQSLRHADLAAQRTPGERPQGQRPVLRQLVDRQRTRPHPGGADKLRRRLDGGIGRRPPDAEQQHAAAPEAQWRDTASKAIPAQENSEQPSTVASRRSRPRTSGSSMPDVTPPTPIIPRITPYMPGAECELLAAPTAAAAPTARAQGANRRSCAPWRAAPPACCARSARRRAWRRRSARVAGR